MIRYARAPSPVFSALLADSPLPKPRIVAGLRLDPQLREGDHFNLYCGLTKLVDASLADGKIRLSAHPTYSGQACAAGLFRDWAPNEAGFSEALDRYFAGVTVKPAQVRAEGAVQAQWAQIREPWIAFDREAVIGYPDVAARQAARSSPLVDTVRAELEGIATDWEKIPKTGGELDQLGVDPDGRLVLIELKDVSSPAYYAPFQLLHYIEEWRRALPTLLPSLTALIEARQKLGISPAMPALNGQIRPVLAFGEGQPSPVVWRRLEAVLGIVNRAAGPIEVWALDAGVPVLLKDA